MCNPRRITIRATRLLNEAWQQEVSRFVELRERVTGEARVRQSLDATLGRPTLRALELALAAEGSGWTEVEEGYRFDVEGGYVVYLVDEQELEIVAVLEDEIEATGQSSRVLEGQIDMEISAEGEGKYYEDGWRGLTREVGEQRAQEDAQRQLDEQELVQIKQAGDEAEAEVSDELAAKAHRQAEERLRDQAALRETDLAEQARRHLGTVGLRCRQAFNRVLATAYRDAILAYARQHGAESIQCNDQQDVVEIEFTFVG